MSRRLFLGPEGYLALPRVRLQVLAALHLEQETCRTYACEAIRRLAFNHVENKERLQGPRAGAGRKIAPSSDLTGVAVRYLLFGVALRKPYRYVCSGI